MGVLDCAAPGVWLDPAKRRPASPFAFAMSKMQGSDKLDEFKDQLTPCVACCCAEFSCGPAMPLCFAGGKVCCCTQSVGLECPPCWMECNEGCYTQDRGICETSQKMCCVYTEVQFPPSQDIGCGFCGVKCCRDTYEGGDAPPNE